VGCVCGKCVCGKCVCVRKGGGRHEWATSLKLQKACSNTYNGMFGIRDVRVRR
jgi:hypothetical protein